MATFLDIGLLQNFTSVFAWLLSFSVVYAILETTKAFGEDKKAINAFFAIILSFLVLLSPDLVNLITFIAPWFVLVFIFVMLLLLVYRMFGATDKNIADFILKDKPVQWALFAVGIIIAGAGIGVVFGQRLLSESGAAANGFTSNVYSALFNTKVMGMLLVFGIAVFAVALLTGDNS